MKAGAVWGSLHLSAGRVGIGDEKRAGGIKLSTRTWPLGGPGRFRQVYKLELWNSCLTMNIRNQSDNPLNPSTAF